MNGNFVLDTNAIVALLNGHTGLAKLLAQANWVGISVISELEFLSFSNLTANDEAVFQQFKSRIEVLDLSATDITLMKGIISIRLMHTVKLPDAIIAASTAQRNATLISNDAGFAKIGSLVVQTF